MELPNIERRGLMLVLSSPSGAGKTSVARSLLKMEPLLHLSVSLTTRPKRPEETEGKDYYFVNEEAFQEQVRQHAFLEYANVFGHWYGTPRAPVEQKLQTGHDILFDIDWQGTQQIAQVASQDLVTIFILPPSWEELKRRLYNRAQDTAAVVQNRMSKATSEISHWAEYEYVVVNQDLDKTVAQIQTILQSERLRRRRQPGLVDFVKQLHPSST